MAKSAVIAVIDTDGGQVVLLTGKEYRSYLEDVLSGNEPANGPVEYMEKYFDKKVALPLTVDWWRTTAELETDQDFKNELDEVADLA